jgi:hypothetical protein
MVLGFYPTLQCMGDPNLKQNLHFHVMMHVLSCDVLVHFMKQKM